ncbi:DsrE family protein [uncultured Roseobacter sp.]|uniref:DsrE family protein n=1 Tax=uncultured Roseobacter sp. TaxID=114847 RepID=UPI00260BE10C|nr:DsrE family protein [uncultured Roseobacter sp.]
MTKTAIVIYSDPKANSEEALGRVFNAMFLAYELKEKKQDVALIFQGTGVRWVRELVTPDHPANALYAAVADTVVGACQGCADVFGATEDVKSTDVALVAEKAIPGTSGVIDLSRYLDEGYRLVTF